MKIFDYPDLISDDESSFFIAADWLEEQSRDYEARYLREGHVFNIWLYFFDVNLNRMFGAGLGHGYGYTDNYGYGDGTVTGYGDGTGIGTVTGYGDGNRDGYRYGGGNGFGYDDDTYTLLSFFTIVSRNLI
jgi:hypothetical protein